MPYQQTRGAGLTESGGALEAQPEGGAQVNGAQRGLDGPVAWRAVLPASLLARLLHRGFGAVVKDRRPSEPREESVEGRDDTEDGVGP